jgi:hypothetical protein
VNRIWSLAQKDLVLTRRDRLEVLFNSQLIAGKILGMVMLSLIQQVVLLGVAQVAFGVDYLRGPAALVILIVTLQLLVSYLGLMLATLLKGEQALVATTPAGSGASPAGAVAHAGAATDAGAAAARSMRPRRPSSPSLQ